MLINLITKIGAQFLDERRSTYSVCSDNFYSEKPRVLRSCLVFVEFADSFSADHRVALLYFAVKQTKT
jgi:hypothetical protein